MMRGLRWLCLLSALLLPPARAGLYSPDEPLVSLAGAARSLLLGSRSAWFAEFYASWCGHCIAFSGTWKALARDVQDWRPAVYLAVLDCAEESNKESCTDFGITGFPTVKFFNAFAESPSDGIRESRNTVQDLRRLIIDRLEEQKVSPPPACPPLEPISAPEVDQFFESNEEMYLALIFEDPRMYMGREVALDMVQYEGVSVRRVLKDQMDLVEKFKVFSFPSGFLLSRNGSTSKIYSVTETRSYYTSFLRALPGVRRGHHALIGWSETVSGVTPPIRRPADSSKVYMADLESALHYSLRMEVARYTTLEGDRLTALINYINVLRKYFPARPYLRTLLYTLSSWLRSQGRKVLYKDFQDVLNNRNQTPRAVLAPDVNWVWCQGSKPQFRGYPCSLWTLFHLLTVQAAELEREGLRRSAPREVLLAMSGYVKYFFGCRECAQHFQSMAVESLFTVRSLDQAITWLWDRHNRVNKRLAGAESDDPEFPKRQWPSSELCPLCQEEGAGQELSWDLQNVLHFLKAHFSRENIAGDYLEDEDLLLEKQNKAGSTGGKRKRRGTVDEKEEKAWVKDQGKSAKAKADREDGERRETDSRPREANPHQRPSIIKMKPVVQLQGEKEDESEIVDLDSIVPHLYRSKSLQDPSLLQDNRVPPPDTLLEPPDSEFDYIVVKQRLLKRRVDQKYMFGVVVESGDAKWKGHWVKMLEVGFSRLDISLCVVLYFLSSMCLLFMYLYLSAGSRCRQSRRACPQV